MGRALKPNITDFLHRLVHLIDGHLLTSLLGYTTENVKI